MREHLHQDFTIDTDDIVEIMSDTQANVMLLSDADYNHYKAGRSFRYYGGFFTHFPAAVPTALRAVARCVGLGWGQALQSTTPCVSSRWAGRTPNRSLHLDPICFGCCGWAVVQVDWR